MHIDFSNIYRNVWNKKTIAIATGLGCSWLAYSMVHNRVMPMAYGAEAPGADINDVITTGLSVLGALVSFIASRYLGITPEIIQAVKTFESDKSNQDALRRLGAAIVGYIVNMMDKHPEGSSGFLLALLTTISSKLDPQIANILNKAAQDIAGVQFKLTPVPITFPIMYNVPPATVTMPANTVEALTVPNTPVV